MGLFLHPPLICGSLLLRALKLTKGFSHMENPISLMEKLRFSAGDTVYGLEHPCCHIWSFLTSGLPVLLLLRPAGVLKAVMPDLALTSELTSHRRCRSLPPYSGLDATPAPSLFTPFQIYLTPINKLQSTHPSASMSRRVSRSFWWLVCVLFSSRLKGSVADFTFPLCLSCLSPDCNCNSMSGRMMLSSQRSPCSFPYMLKASEASINSVWVTAAPMPLLWILCIMQLRSLGPELRLHPQVCY